MQAPKQTTPTGPADYLEVMTKAVFQSGMSWQVVEAKWPGFREAFDGFDPQKVAGYTGDDVERLAADTRIIRNRRKIEATLTNAETMLELERSREASPAGCARTPASRPRSRRCVQSSASWARPALLLSVRCRRAVPTHEEWMKTHPGAPRGASGPADARACDSYCAVEPTIAVRRATPGRSGAPFSSRGDHDHHRAAQGA